MEYIYDSYHSPDMTRQAGTGQKGTADPTAAAFHKADGLRKRYEKMFSRQLDEQLYIEDKIKDDEIKRVIIMYYFAGLSWKETYMRGAQKKVIEYLEDHAEELNG